jgi:metallo-beta-lactamase family protein
MMNRSDPAVLRFLGGAGTVTGSKYWLSHGESSIMVDCGLFQGLKELRERNWSSLPIDAAALYSVVLSHAHLDHCGHLPKLVAEGFTGLIHTTADTARLTSIVLPDSAHLQEEEARFANKAGFSRHHPALPLYDADDVARTLPLLREMDLGERREVAPGIWVTLRRSGHILGSASPRVELDGRSVTFSGDLGRTTHPLLLPPEPIGDTDVIVVESTYGDQQHDDDSAVAMLRDVIQRTIGRGGTVIIPAFAVDRTEVLLHHLGHLDDRGELPAVPVYVDSPMSLAALRVYREAIERRSPEIRPEVISDPTPFLEHRVHEVHDSEASKRLTASSEPKIIISASGMASGGRVVHHLARFLPDSKNTVVLVGYQAVGTRGRSLADGAEELKMLGRYVRVKSEVVNLPSFSVHADAPGIIDWLRTAEREPAVVYVTHGEPVASRALAARIRSELDWVAVVPTHDELVSL